MKNRQHRRRRRRRHRRHSDEESSYSLENQRLDSANRLGRKNQAPGFSICVSLSVFFCLSLYLSPFPALSAYLFVCLP